MKNARCLKTRIAALCRPLVISFVFVAAPVCAGTLLGLSLGGQTLIPIIS